MGLDKTRFWCDRHREKLMASGADPGNATHLLAAGLHLLGVPPEPVQSACCRFPEEVVTRVLAKTQPSWWRRLLWRFM